MIPEIGQFSLILALCMAVLQTALPVTGAALRTQSILAGARYAAIAHLLFLLISFACLTYAFISYDFSVYYVVQNSNSALPLMYRISGVWGAHEGSMLLWVLMLAGWTAAVAWFSREVPDTFLARVLAVLGVVSVGFLLFLILTSNPFERIIPAAAEGRDLNPLLQDPGLVFHPPMLYMGYVGFSVAFSFAVAALLSGRLDAAWARWSKPWTNLAWVFLTLGITLGSWWAYYELGWGGWWFWDPVENASFMPWLVGTALIHSLSATEKRGLFKSWTVLLAMLTFSLSLIGAFLVRSGVLTSVHTFATDPSRGVFLLILISLVIGGSLAIYAYRAPSIRSSGSYAIVSREAGILLNNIFLVTAAATILLGTLYPLFLDALGLGKVSVGPPYFNSVFIPLTIPLAALVGVGAMSRWKKDRIGRLMGGLWPLLLFSMVAGIGLPFLADGPYQWLAAVGLTVAIWTTASTAYGLLDRVRNRPNKISALLRQPRGIWGMSIAHFGIAVFVVGVTMVSLYETEQDLKMVPGDSYELGGVDFKFVGVGQIPIANYISSMGTVEASRDGRHIVTLHPEKRFYPIQPEPLTEAGIRPGLFEDLYVSLGEPLGDEGSWSVRIHVKPFVRWIWAGAILMSLGALLALADQRFRVQRRRSAAESNIAAASGV
ncbi:MAG: heme lyase CcmF/NrfE family subunit [Acidiferrobacterales bacterium]|nr:heme lyase CcmF/NrfE family subunit [Acidiferrobacterales bacterium]